MNEREAKTLLMKRLDECLTEHAKAIFAGSATPIIKDIYEMQYLSELHYYLKVEHPFTPAEVEALLEFKDPLNAARWCREENSHKHSFPICELLEQIGAYDRFERYAHTPSLEEKALELTKLLGQNYYVYMEEIRSLGVPEVIDRCQEIAAAMTAYRYMTEEYKLTHETADYLLRFENPLELIRSYWPDGIIEGEIVLQTLMDDVPAPQEERPTAPRSVKERLQAAAQEASRQGAPEPKPRDHGAR